MKLSSLVTRAEFLVLLLAVKKIAIRISFYVQSLHIHALRSTGHMTLSVIMLTIVSYVGRKTVQIQ